MEEDLKVTRQLGIPKPQGMPARKAASKTFQCTGNARDTLFSALYVLYHSVLCNALLHSRSWQAGWHVNRTTESNSLDVESDVASNDTTRNLTRAEIKRCKKMPSTDL